MIWFKMKILLVFSCAAILLIGCSPSPFEPGTAASTAIISIQTATNTSEFMQLPAPSPTDLQPLFNPNAENSEYCKPPNAVLPVEDGNDISENEIVHELLRIWLRRYLQDAAPPACRIADFSIDNVYEDPSIYSQELEPRGDFKRVVVFSVKPTQVSSDWMGFTGELDQDNWLHISHIVAITETSEGYKLEFAYP